MSKDKTISIKLVKSGIGRMENHKLCIKGLGFKKLNQTVKVLDTPSNRGMINKISDMLRKIDINEIFKKFNLIIDTRGKYFYSNDKKIIHA